jgi:hypothetical protein
MTAEYTKLLAELDKDDAYAQILAKEKTTLSTINLVVEHERRKAAKGATIFSMTISELVADFAHSIVGTMEALMTVKDYDEFVALFSDSRRALYTGALMIFVAVIVLLLT